uniref:Fibrinogen C-terminal domain-containing protein n=1 Tax=Amphimedon queenslandica TaxID=400682 RepID=A0A1X7SQZ9_AMPQE
MEVNDTKNLYDVTELQDYDDQSGYKPGPVTSGGLQHQALVSVGKFGTVILIVVALLIFLGLVILLGITGLTLTNLNKLPVCDNTASTSSGVSATIKKLPNCTVVYSTWTDELVKNNTILQTKVMELSMALERQGNKVNQLTNTSARIFNVAQDTAMKVDDIYSYTDINTTGNIKQILNTTKDSANMLLDIVGSLTNIEGNGISTAAIVDDIILVANKLLELQNESTLVTSTGPVSCNDIKMAHPNSVTGYYHAGGHTIYCNMDQLCSSGGGWTRVAYLDMSDATQSCPTGFTLYTLDGNRYCGRSISNSPSCTSAKFFTNGISYSQICGRVEGYQKNTPDALYNGNPQRNNIDSSYVDGVSITRGSPRQHVWTLVATGATTIFFGGQFNCPCSPGSVQQVPSFIGNNYYCEGGRGDPLWDGQDCLPIETNCCSSPYLPWFYRQYNASTTDYIELRVCGDQSTVDEDAPVGLYEIYVK